MNKKIHTAGQGLTLIYYSQILVLVSSICLAFITLWQPFGTISSILTTCGLFFSLFGLAITSKTHKNFKIAFISTLINIALSLSTAFFVFEDFYPIMASCSNLLTIITAIFVILGAQKLCQSRSVKIKGFNKTVMFVYLFVFFLATCINIVYATGFFDLKLASITTSIITFLGNFCYIHYLNRARKVLQ